MKNKIVDAVIISSCILTIIVGSVFGAWALLQTL
jgi:hypothetical protein